MTTVSWTGQRRSHDEHILRNFNRSISNATERLCSDLCVISDWGRSSLVKFNVLKLSTTPDCEINIGALFVRSGSNNNKSKLANLNWDSKCHIYKKLLWQNFNPTGVLPSFQHGNGYAESLASQEKCGPSSDLGRGSRSGSILAARSVVTAEAGIYFLSACWLDFILFCELPHNYFWV